MATKYQDTARDILAGVGGEANVANAQHCATRLRLTLKNKALVNKAAVEAVPGVITTVESGGQFQVVIGDDVPLVYQELRGLTTSAVDDSSAPKPTGNLLDRFIALISAIIQPVLWPLAGAGLLKALLAMSTTFGWLDASSGAYTILSAAGDSIFYFLPIMLAITSAKHFSANQFTSVAIAGALVYPTIVAATSAGTGLDFFGIPVVMMSYSSSVVPIIVAVFVQSKLEKLFIHVLPRVIRNFTVPLISFVVMVPLTLLTIGPATMLLAQVVGQGIGWIWATAPWLAGMVTGGLWNVLVIFGLHWGFVPLIVNELTLQGHSLIAGPVLNANLGIAAATLGVAIRSRNAKRKQLAYASSTACFVSGIVEPSLYGVLLPLKRPFVIACVAAGLGGAVLAAGGGGVSTFAIPGLVTLPVFFGVGNFTMTLIGGAVTVIAGLVGAMLFGVKETDADLNPGVPGTVSEPAGADARYAATTRSSDIVAPMVGTMIPLSEVNDPVFSKGAMGKGYGLVPVDGRVLAPFDGTVVVAMESGHAVGLRSVDGVELMIHVGIDTVRLQGECFVLACKRGDSVKKGDLLLTADLAAIRAAGYDATTVVVCTNSDRFTDISTVATGEVDPATPTLAVVA
jgi:PTS system beta-glucosides-specific IIC component